MSHTCDHKHDRTHKQKACGCHSHEEHTCGCHDHDDHGCSCGCGHDHDHAPERGEGIVLAIGAALFALGFLPLGIVSTLLHIAAYLLLGLPVLINAGKNILKGHVFDENFLMGIATLGAFCIGEVPEAVGVMLFYRFGEYFEHKATSASRKHILEAVDLRPETVTLADGQVIPAEGKGWVLACFAGLPLGWGKISDGMMKNHYPKGLRR